MAWEAVADYVAAEFVALGLLLVICCLLGALLVVCWKILGVVRTMRGK